MRRTICLALAGLFLMLGQAAWALGLGQARASSYLQQPLELRIDLISRSEAELATVTAGLASAADFRVMGLNSGVIGMPLEFTIERNLEDPHIRVQSRQAITEPVLQLVIEVVWASGRMVRQYTVFLDPPTFDSAAPLPSVTPRAAPAPVPVTPASPTETLGSTDADEPVTDALADTAPEWVPEPQATESTPVLESGPPFEPGSEPVARSSPDADAAGGPELPVEPLSEPAVVETPVPEDAPWVPEPPAKERPSEAEEGMEIAEVSEADVTEPDTDAGAPVQDLAVNDLPAATPEPGVPAPGEPMPEAPKPEAPAEATEVAAVEAPAIRAALPDPGTPAPAAHRVEQGQTLWGLSNRWAQENGVDVNQMMLAVQQRNPEAFINGNINALKAGALLRVPQAPDEFTYDQRQAMLEVMRQEQIYRNRWDIPVDPESLPTVADLAHSPTSAAADDSAATGPVAEAVDDFGAATVEEGRLELVPPSESTASGDSPAQGATGDAGTAGEAVVQELARAEEELANARQENDYLNERIRELEEALEQTRADIEDSGLAQMQAELREQRESGETQPLAVVPADTPEPWLARYVWWLVGALVVLISGLVWWLRHRSDDSEYIENRPLS